VHDVRRHRPEYLGMSAFIVKITVPGSALLTRTAIAVDGCALIMAAQDEFGPCSVTVTPA
jgi:hypothetical protein